MVVYGKMFLSNNTTALLQYHLAKLDARPSVAVLSRYITVHSSRMVVPCEVDCEAHVIFIFLHFYRNFSQTKIPQ